MDNTKKYYTRHIKITKITREHAETIDYKKLLFCYTGDEYESLNFYNKFECLNEYSEHLYKYSEKYYETQNIIFTNKPTNKVFLNSLEPDFLSFKNYFNNVDSQNIIRTKRIKLNENIIIGLYNDINNNYTFVKNSQYDALTHMFMIFI